MLQGFVWAKNDTKTKIHIVRGESIPGSPSVHTPLCNNNLNTGS